MARLHTRMKWESALAVAGHTTDGPKQKEGEATPKRTRTRTMPRPSRALLLLALLLVAALAQPAACAKKAAAKKGAAKKSAVGVVDTDEDDASDGGLAAGYGNLGWITMAQFEV